MLSRDRRGAALATSHIISLEHKLSLEPNPLRLLVILGPVRHLFPEESNCGSLRYKDLRGIARGWSGGCLAITWTQLRHN